MDRSRSDSKNSLQNDRTGSYKSGDKVNQILSIRQFNQESYVEFYVSWEKRENGKTP